MLNISQLFDMSINLSGSQLLSLADKRTKPHQIHFPALAFSGPCFLCDGGSTRVDPRKKRICCCRIGRCSREIWMVVVKGKYMRKSEVRSDPAPAPAPASLFIQQILISASEYLHNISMCQLLFEGLYKDERIRYSGEKHYYDAYVTDEETEVQIGDTTEPKSDSQSGLGLDSKPRQAGSGVMLCKCFFYCQNFPFSSVKNLHIKKQNLLHCKKRINHSRHIQANTYPIYLYVITLSQESATLGIPVFL